MPYQGLVLCSHEAGPWYTPCILGVSIRHFVLCTHRGRILAVCKDTSIMCAYTTQVYVGSCPVCTPTSLRDQCMSSSQCMDGPSSAAAMLLFTAARLHVGLLSLVIADCFLWFYCWSAPRPASQVLGWTVCCEGCAANTTSVICICSWHFAFPVYPSFSRHSSIPATHASQRLCRCSLPRLLSGARLRSRP
jgi:hypothetical protein